MTVAACVLTVLAVRLRWPPGRTWVRSRLHGRAPRPGAAWLGLVAVGIGAVALPRVPAVTGPGIVLVATTGAVGWFVVRQVRAARSRAVVARRRDESLELVGLIGAELRAGALAQRMIGGLAGDFPVLAPAARVVELGGDVAGALRDAAQEPGRELLRDVAAGWQVSERSGAPLASVIDRVEQSARVEREILREVEAGAAPARATARLMAALPGMGLLLGSGMGGDPVHVLTATWLGVGCLAAGCALACAGVAWIERIAVSAGDAR